MLDAQLLRQQLAAIDQSFSQLAASDNPKNYFNLLNEYSYLLQYLFTALETVQTHQDLEEIIKKFRDELTRSAQVYGGNYAKVLNTVIGVLDIALAQAINERVNLDLRDGKLLDVIYLRIQFCEQQINANAYLNEALDTTLYLGYELLELEKKVKALKLTDQESRDVNETILQEEKEASDPDFTAIERLLREKYLLEMALRSNEGEVILSEPETPAEPAEAKAASAADEAKDKTKTHKEKLENIQDKLNAYPANKVEPVERRIAEIDIENKNERIRLPKELAAARKSVRLDIQTKYTAPAFRALYQAQQHAEQLQGDVAVPDTSLSDAGGLAAPLLSPAPAALPDPTLFFRVLMIERVRIINDYRTGSLTAEAQRFVSRFQEDYASFSSEQVATAPATVPSQAQAHDASAASAAAASELAPKKESKASEPPRQFANQDYNLRLSTRRAELLQALTIVKRELEAHQVVLAERERQLAALKINIDRHLELNTELTPLQGDLEVARKLQKEQKGAPEVMAPEKESLVDQAVRIKAEIEKEIEKAAQLKLKIRAQARQIKDEQERYSQMQSLIEDGNERIPQIKSLAARKSSLESKLNMHDFKVAAMQAAKECMQAYIIIARSRGALTRAFHNLYLTRTKEWDAMNIEKLFVRIAMDPTIDTAQKFYDAILDPRNGSPIFRNRYYGDGDMAKQLQTLVYDRLNSLCIKHKLDFDRFAKPESVVDSIINSFRAK